jgi:decaprenylphospho-beta-D-ribofuranose 2-oxidase
MAAADTLTGPAGGTRSLIHGWGGGPAAPVTLVAPRDQGELSELVCACARDGRRAIVRGLGRSYGDAAQLTGGLVLETRACKRIELDTARGVVRAQAGASIGELLDAVVPSGWMVPVMPGTQHVSVGGAIASDIHGKNHGIASTFGNHVLAIGLLRADGELLELEPQAPLFQATLGGMGLTGIIVWARIALAAVGSALVSVDTDRARDLDHILALLSEPGGPYRVAWVDLLGPRAGRGIVTRADHVDADAAGPAAAEVTAAGQATVRARATVPAHWPGSLLRPSTVGTFNELRYRRAPRRERGRLESLGSHMFPLDALDAWPRLYGPSGFVQYQLVVPPQQARVMQAVIEHLSRCRVPCFLAVLKDFGPANQAPLSFPIAGWTLTLDLPRAAPGLGPALDHCDELVAAAGGRVYLSKDARLSAAALRAMYPRLAEWRSIRDEADPAGLWCSDLAARTGLVEA